MIITLMSLPGVGKSSMAKSLAAELNYKYRLEPTDDIDEITPCIIQDLVLSRFFELDRNLDTKKDYIVLDSDYWTSLYLFGGTKEISGNQLIPDILILLTCSAELQEQNIRTRKRPFFNYELNYCQKNWKDKLEYAYNYHPAPVKIIVNIDELKTATTKVLQALLPKLNSKPDERLPV